MSVKNNLRTVELADAKQMIQDYEFAVIYEISKMHFDKVESISEIKWDEMQEAYFFNEAGQLHMFRDEDTICATVFTEDEDITHVDRLYEISNGFKVLGKEIKERTYLEFDEDGQAYVAYTRLVSVQ